MSESIHQVEMAVVANLAMYPEKIPEVRDGLDPAYFQHVGCREMYKAILQLTDKGHEIDVATIVQSIGSKRLGEIGGTEFVNDVLEAYASTSTEIVGKVAAIRDTHMRRSVHTSALTTAQHALDNVNYSSHDLQLDVDKIQTALACGTGDTPGQDLDILLDSSDGIGDFAKVGWDVIDEMLSPEAGGGLPLDQFGILSADASVGKTTFSLNLAVRVAMQTGHGVLYMPTEESFGEIRSWLGRLGYRASLSAFETPTDQSWENYGMAKAKQYLGGLPLYVSPVGNMPIDAVCDRIVSYRRKKGVRLAIVDRLEKLRWADGGNEASAIANTIRPLGPLASNHGCCILLVVQPKRRREDHEMRRPRMEDLKGASALEQDARFIIMLHSWYRTYRRAAENVESAAKTKPNTKTYAAAMAQAQELRDHALEHDGYIDVGITKQKFGAQDIWSTMGWDYVWHYMYPLAGRGTR